MSIEFYNSLPLFYNYSTVDKYTKNHDVIISGYFNVRAGKITNYNKCIKKMYNRRF